MKLRITTVDTVAMLWQWLRRTDVRVAMAGIIAGLVFQQHQIVQAQERLASVEIEVAGTRELVESQLILACLDSTKTLDLQKSKAPCARLFDKYGIQR